MLFVAKSGAPFAASPALLHPILDQVAEGAVTLINTPPGYLMAENLAAVLVEHNRPVLWLRLGAEDRDPATFLLSLILAAQSQSPGIGAITLQQMRSSPGPISGWASLFACLGHELGEALPASSALVIEHFHYLKENQIVLNLVNTHFLPSLPPGFTTILISHQSIPVSGFSNSTSLIGVKDLRVDARSGLALAKNTETDLPGDVVRRALALIEGRLAGLTGLLSAAQMLGPEFVQHAVNRSRTANDLLAMIVRGSLASADSTHIQALALAVQLEYSHPQLSEAAFGARINPSGPWFQPLQNEWSRVRQMWKTPLKNALRTALDASYNGLHRAADFLVQQGAPEKAIELYLEIGDRSTAARIMAAVSEKMMNLGQWDTLEAWLEQLTPDAFHEWPWLVYMAGELATARGSLDAGRLSFAQAAALFQVSRVADGVCLSLLAESALAAWQDDYDQAWLCAREANALAEASGQSQNQAWAAWQLGCLAAGANRMEESLAYFNKATSTISDHEFDTLFTNAETLTLRQHEIHQKREFHRQAVLDLEKAEQETSSRLSTLIHSQPENLDRLLNVYGWTRIPLIFKFNPSSILLEPVEEPGRFNIWQILRQGLWKSLFLKTSPDLNILNQADKSLIDALRTGSPGPAASKVDVADDLAVPTIAILPAEIITPLAETNLSARKLSEASVQISRQQPVGPGVPPVNPPSRWLLSASLLAPFQVSINDYRIEKWPGSRAAAVLKYLLAHRQQPIPREVLMDTFWQEAGPDSARNSLNVAIHHLRQAFRAASEIPILIFEKSSYHFNPELQIWLDVDEFERHLSAGRQLEAEEQISLAMTEYQAAASLYRGDFMADDPYEEWPVLPRERLRIAYLDLLDRLSHIYFSQGQYAVCAELCQSILEKDGCREDTHCLLMRSFSRQGQQHQALRQYQVCRDLLRADLDVDPEPATTQLAEHIRRHERV